MRGVDILIVVVLLAAVAFSFLGVASYEADGGMVDYRVRWQEDTTPLSEKQTQRQGNGEIGLDYPINLANLTQVQLNVRVAGSSNARVNPVTAQITVTPVNATAQTKSVTLTTPNGGPQEASFTVDLQSAPTIDRTSGPSDNDTLTQLDETYRTTNGTGTWKVTVTLSGAAAGLPGIGAETFTITVDGQAKSYRATLELLVPDVDR